jgi:hypothetical protein
LFALSEGVFGAFLGELKVNIAAEDSLIGYLTSFLGVKRYLTAF